MFGIPSRYSIPTKSLCCLAVLCVLEILLTRGVLADFSEGIPDSKSKSTRALQILKIFELGLLACILIFGWRSSKLEQGCGCGDKGVQPSSFAIKCEDSGHLIKLSSDGIAPAGREASLFNDDIFAKLRRTMGVPDDFLNIGWSFENLESGGGKGGTLMAFIDELYIVKELTRGDHKVLFEIADSYFHHVTEGNSCLCSILMHFEDRSTGRLFFAMRNEMGAGPFKAMYDLKGCADDKTLALDGKKIQPVRKRIWNVWMWGGQCMWSPDRRIYYQGKLAARKVKIHLTREQREEVCATIRRDTEWLAQEGLMDYSLLVGIQEADRIPLDPGSPRWFVDHRALVHRKEEGTEVAVRLGIIDFLQRWTAAKVVANCIKFLERNKSTIRPIPYADRFLKHFEKNIVSV